MFVTSDIFDLEGIARWRGEDWRECLVGGVEVHGTYWRGYQADARFMLAAAQRCGVVDDLRWAGYRPQGERRTRNIKPQSFERLALGELKGAKEAIAVL